MAKVKWRGKQVQREIEGDIVSRLKSAGVYLRRKVVRKISKPSRQGRSKPGQPPHADTGRLRQSIFWDVNSKKLELIVGTTVKYGAYLERGARILPKKAKALAVPISKRAQRHAGSPRTFPIDLVMIQRPGRPPLLIESKKKVTIVHYILLSHATLEKRPYLVPTLEQNLKKIEAIIIRGRKRNANKSKSSGAGG